MRARIATATKAHATNSAAVAASVLQSLEWKLQNEQLGISVASPGLTSDSEQPEADAAAVLHCQLSVLVGILFIRKADASMAAKHHGGGLPQMLDLGEAAPVCASLACCRSGADLQICQLRKSSAPAYLREVAYICFSTSCKTHRNSRMFAK